VETAFVLGGGGVLGAYEVGMLRALSEAGVTPDVVVGTSVGAINSAFVAADPAGAAAWLAGVWQGEALQRAFRETIFGRAARLARSGTHLHSIEPLRQMLEGGSASTCGSPRTGRRAPRSRPCPPARRRFPTLRRLPARPRSDHGAGMVAASRREPAVPVITAG
jgi:hypothetical protein